MLASLRDVLVHVYEVVIHILHLDHILPLGHAESTKNGKSTNLLGSSDGNSHGGGHDDQEASLLPDSGDGRRADNEEEPKWTMTIETLSPRSFASKIHPSTSDAFKTPNDPSEDTSAQVIQDYGGTAAFAEDTANSRAFPEDTNTSGAFAKDTDNSGAFAEDTDNSGAFAEEIATPLVVQADKAPPQLPTPTSLSDLTPETQPFNDATTEARAGLAAIEREMEKLDRTKGENDPLAWSSAPADAAGGVATSPNDFAHINTKRSFAEDLEGASVASNATDDTEEDRVRALYDIPTQKPMTRAEAVKRDPDPADWSSSDDEETLKSELYASSPRCVPPLVRTSFTSI